MEKKYKVYKHTFPNGKIYIGITSKVSIEQRWGENGKYYKGQFVYNAIKKYGWNNIKHEVLFEDLTKDQAEQKEIELIALCESNKSNKGYNIQNGGNTQGTMAVSTREKISRLRKEYIKNNGSNWKENFQSEDAQKKRKQKLLEYYKNNVVSAETRQKISKAAKGKTGHKWTDEEKLRHSELFKDRVFTEEWKNKISISKQGNKNAMYGKKMSEEHKRKIAEGVSKGSHKKPIVCIENDITYISLSEASRQLNIPSSSIYKVCKGERNSTHNLHFKFL